jgi:hypothetical protein
MSQHFYDYVAVPDNGGGVDYDEDSSNNNSVNNNISKKTNKHNITNDKQEQGINCGLLQLGYLHTLLSRDNFLTQIHTYNENE